MKPAAILLATALVLPACDRQRAAQPREIPTAHFKAGHGVSLPEPMLESLGIEVEDVAEQSFVPRLEIPLHALGGTEAGGWLSAAQAAAIAPGRKVQLVAGNGDLSSGTVRTLRASASPTLGDFELSVALDTPLPAGAALTGILDGAPTAEVVTVPAAAVLRTAEGEFVYVANESYFTRTAVKTAARNDRIVEVTDGLYAGDRIVAHTVAPLWMTELQSLRAGQSCSHGH